MASPASGISLDPWFDNYADRASGLSASEVRALFAVASRPEVVSLAGGMPFVAALPFEKVRSSVSIASCEIRVPQRCNTAPGRDCHSCASASWKLWLWRELEPGSMMLW